jgi:thioredoxin reductase (NADPH)
MSDGQSAETSDRIGAFPRLDDPQIELLARNGERRQVEVGDVLFREGDPTHRYLALRREPGHFRASPRATD